MSMFMRIIFPSNKKAYSSLKLKQIHFEKQQKTKQTTPSLPQTKQNAMRRNRE